MTPSQIDAAVEAQKITLKLTSDRGWFSARYLEWNAVKPDHLRRLLEMEAEKEKDSNGRA